MNKVLLTGRLTRDPEMRSLASGKAVTQFSVATNEYIGQGKEKAEYHNIVTWDRLAQTCGEFLGKGQQVAIEGRIQTRSWDDKTTGEKRSKIKVEAERVQFLDRRDESAGPGPSSLDDDYAPPPPHRRAGPVPGRTGAGGHLGRGSRGLRRPSP